ncbi:oligosaccharide flippase family protein [Vibrio splendidus]
MKSLLKGSGYFAIASYITVLFSVIITMVNGKVLTAEDYGIIAISLVFTSMLESLKQLGFKEYLISKNDIDDREAEENNAWTLDLIKSIVLSLVSLLSIPLMVGIYEEERIALVIAIVSIMFVVEGITSPKLYLSRKNLQYNIIVKINLITSVVYCISTILLVMYFENYIGVIIGLLCKSFTSVLLSYYFYPVKPKLTLNLIISKKQFKYGKWILLSGLVYYFTNRFDNFALSLNVTLTDLGYYGFAFSLVNGVLGLPIKSVNNALFPILSSNKHDLSKTNVISFIAFFSALVALIMSWLLPWVAINLIDEKWYSSKDVISLLVIAFCINAIKVDGFFLSKNKPEYKFFVEFIRGMLMLLLCIPFIKWLGIIGAPIALVCANTASLFVWFYVMKKV